MAQLMVDGDTLVVRLSPLEKLGALRGGVRVPLRAVGDVRVTDQPWTELRGIRAPGTGIPKVIALGIRRGPHLKDFAAVYRDRPAVVVELNHAVLGRLVISADDPSGVAARLAEARSALPPG